MGDGSLNSVKNKLPVFDIILVYEQNEKLPCCRAKIYKFGDKQRQCSLCKKTWTV